MHAISIRHSVLFLGLLILLSTMAQAAEHSAFQAQCKQFAQVNDDYLATESTNANSFWSNPTIRKTYLVALHGNAQSAQRAISGSDDADAARAAVLLAGLVKHDSNLMRAGFSDGAVAYFNGKSIFTPLTMAASCDFDAGVAFLLQKNLDPNAGDDVGAFNASLANQNDAIERQLLAAGYKVDSNEKRCESSKQILQKNSASTPGDVRAAVESSSCSPASESAK